MNLKTARSQLSAYWLRYATALALAVATALPVVNNLGTGGGNGGI